MNLLVKQLLHHKLRTLLAFLSIFIATLFLVVVVGVSNIVQEKFVSTLNRLSSDIFILLPFKVKNILFLQKESRTALVIHMFSKSDLQYIQTLPSVKEAYPVIQTNMPVNGYRFSVTGLPAKAAPKIILNTVDLRKGRLYKRKGEAVLGPQVAKELEVDIGDNIYIDNERVKVVGILKRVGQSLINSDNSVFVEYTMLKEMLGLTKIPAIIGIAKNTTKAQSDILNYLDLKYNGDWYSIITGESISKQLTSLIDIVKWFFLSIAIVTVIVSLIVIWNSIYTNILDNYNIIATLKVLGMTKKDIIKLYVGQGLVLTLGAIVISMPIAFLLGVPLEQQLAIYGLLILGSFVSSYWPAKKAAEIPPIEALRYG